VRTTLFEESRSQRDRTAKPVRPGSERPGAAAVVDERAGAGGAGSPGADHGSFRRINIAVVRRRSRAATSRNIFSPPASLKRVTIANGYFFGPRRPGAVPSLTA